MSWLDRVQGTIELVSPDGAFFSVKWAGDSRSVQKKLGIFTYPKFDGAVVQDLGLAGTTYPLKLYFDGTDNDLEASRFFDAFSARGAWLIKHPTKGPLKLQPVSVTENIQPIESGSITVMDTEWLQPVDVGLFASVVQLAARIRDAVLNTQAITLFVFTTISKQDSVEQVNTTKSATETTLSAYDKTLTPLLETSSSLTAQAASIRRGINDSLSTTPIDLTVLGGQIQTLVDLLAQTEGELVQILKRFTNFIDVLAILPDNGTGQNYINLLATRELFLTETLSTMALISTSGIIDTRAQALEAVGILIDYFQTITDALDAAQEQFLNERVDQQYFSQSNSFVETAQIIANAIKHLLAASFDLAIEKRFTLDRERAPIEIVITEYGELGDEDSNFDLFIASNQLKGNDILVLPAGREVVIYA